MTWLSDYAINGISLRDTIKSGDATGAVGAILGFGSLSSIKPAAVASALGAVVVSQVIIADKIVSGEGVKLSDTMAAQAALAALAGSAANLAGDVIKVPAWKAAAEATSVAANTFASAELATAFTMSKTNVDFSVYDPQNKTGLPSIWDIENNREHWNKLGNIFLNNIKNSAQEFDKNFESSVQYIGNYLLPRLINLSENLEKIFDPNTWERALLSHARNELESDPDYQSWKKEQEKSEAENSNGQPTTTPWQPNFDLNLPWIPSYDPEWKGVPFLPNPFVPDGHRGWYDNGYQCLKPWTDKPNRNGKYHQYDPLTLDLDGDGIETIAAAGFAGSLFDHNRDGIRTATGWVAADDGLLVRDLNGNGKIDNGGELFGDNTLLKNGNTAAHGYAALADLDDNGDGKIDASDAAFADLRVWRDLNQDGESQSNELLTLQDLGIQSLNTAYKDSNKNLGNGNTLAQTGSYTKTDGTTADMGDLLLAHDALHSRFTDKVELTAEQARAANLSGIGRLRDLREAAALSGDLANVLKAYSAAETKEAQLALLDALVHEWAETDSEWGKKPFLLSSSWVRTANEGVALTPGQISKFKGNEMIFLSDEAQAAIDAARDRIAILDAFSGQDSSTLYYMSEEDALNIVKVTNDTYNSLATNIYQSLLLQTRLLPYINQIGFKIENEQFVLDFTAVIAAFNQVHESNPQKAFVDLGELLAYGKLNDWAEGRLLLAQYIQEAQQSGALDGYVAALGNDVITLLNATQGTNKDDVLQDLEWTGKKNVRLYAGAGNDTLIGGTGNDGLYGEADADTLIGGTGNDELYGGAGNDTLIGGIGNDYLEGGSDADTYVFAKGHGSDTVYDSSKQSTVQFTDVNFADVKFRREDNDLVLFGYNGNDSVRLRYYMNSSYWNDSVFQFADKTISTADLMKNGLVLQGSDSDESIYGWSYRNEIYGAAGNDTIVTYDSDDILDGGAGDDALYGNAGKDTLIGGAGNDYLDGSAGNDTYVFNQGFGRDTVYDYGSGDKNVLQFNGINAAEISAQKSGSDLLLTAADGSSVKVQYYFSGNSYGAESFVFNDGTVNRADVDAYFAKAGNNLVQSMASFGVQNETASASVSDNTVMNLPVLTAPAVS